jgi:predicted component of viral defense system (DUF524 family)
LELDIKENIGRLKIIEIKLNKLICEGGGLGSGQYNDLLEDFTNQLQTITDDFNNQISGLSNSITSLPTYPFSSNNVNYVDANNTTKNLQAYLNNIDSQLSYIPNQITNLTNLVCQCDNIINFGKHNLFIT